MLEAGGQIGAYVIDREIGRGGMGVVYLGHDTRLDRAVAIKSLPEHFASDKERLSRFEREAKTLAQLHHNNVAGIYGVEVKDNQRFLILEYVEGETLAEKLDRGPIPVEEAVEIAVQIAAGVEAAHEAGVIHRDLKPANIKFDAEGHAKVLDFGLARTEEHSTTGSSVSQMPTLASPARNSPTMPGVILGTAAYMSPEQARGRKVDKRTDNWSFGVLLYEMLTGAGPFVGETVTDSIGAILHKDVDLARLPEGTPPMVRHVLRRCLERDKHERLRDIGDARLDLLNSSVETEQQATRTMKVRLLPVVGLMLIVAVIAGVAGRFMNDYTAAPDEPMHVAIPMRTAENVDVIFERQFDIADSFGEIVFVGREEDADDDAVASLYIRSLGERVARKIPGTEHARRVAVSPDEQQLLFVWDDPDSSREEIRRVSIEGGPVATLLASDTEPGFGVSAPIVWISPTSILVVGSDRLTMYELSMETLDTTLLMDVSQAIPGSAFVFQGTLLSDGKTMIYSVATSDPERGASIGLFVFDLEKKEARHLLFNAEDATVFDDGRRIAFIRSGDLCVAPYDSATNEVVGEFTPLISSVGGYKISDEGDLYYFQNQEEAGDSRLVLIDMSGDRETLVESKVIISGSIRISPDGKSIVVTTIPYTGGPPEAQVLDIEVGYLNPILHSEYPTATPVWISDEVIGYVLFTSFGQMEIQSIRYGIDSEGTTLSPLGEEGGVQVVPSFTSDGHWMAYQFASGIDSPNRNIYIADTTGDGEARALVESNAADTLPAFSPNDKWLAYTTDISGDFRAVMQEFDAKNGTLVSKVIPVSLGPGGDPVWSRDGQYLYFMDRSERLLKRVSVEYSPEIKVSAPEIVLTKTQLEGLDIDVGLNYDIMPDGQHFVFLEESLSQDKSHSIDVTLNWIEELRQRVPLTSK